MILVVDDTPANIDVVLAIIGEMDDIAVALDGEEALVIIEEDKPDVVLLDIVMPGIDGFEVCKRVKANPDTAATPIIFLSGNGSDEEKAKGSELGAVGFLTKPIDPDKLTAAVKPYI
jgi:CheY-like chemotaxis protein